MTNGKSQMKWNREGIGAAVLFAITSGLGCTAVLGDFSVTHESMTEDSGAPVEASAKSGMSARRARVPRQRVADVRRRRRDAHVELPEQLQRGQVPGLQTGNCAVQRRGFVENVRQRWSLGPGHFVPLPAVHEQCVQRGLHPGQNPVRRDDRANMQGTEWSISQCPFACIDPGVCGGTCQPGDVSVRWQAASSLW